MAIEHSHEVLVMGSGFIAQRGHVYAGLSDPELSGVHFTIFDTDESKLTPNLFADSDPERAATLQQGVDDGRLEFVNDLAKIATAPDVAIIATNNGHHLEAHDMVYRQFGIPGAVGWEKTLIEQSELEGYLTAVRSGRIDESKIVVNETRALSDGVIRGREIVNGLLANGHRIEAADAVNQKYRRGRFFPEDGAWAIESVHAITALYGLTGILLEGDQVTTNLYWNPKEEGKEATYGIFEVPQDDGIRTILVRVAQNLGGSIDVFGNRVASLTPPQLRTAAVHLSDGHTVHLRFDRDAVEDKPGMNTILQHSHRDKILSREVIPDDTIQRFLRGLLKMSVTGENNFLEPTKPSYGLHQSALVKQLFDTATILHD